MSTPSTPRTTPSSGADPQPEPKAKSGDASPARTRDAAGEGANGADVAGAAGAAGSGGLDAPPQSPPKLTRFGRHKRPAPRAPSNKRLW